MCVYMLLLSLDIAWPVSVSCIVGDLGFYERLILSTLAPVVVLSVLMCTYLVALYRHRGSMAEDVEERQRATVRHASAALLVCFLVCAVRVLIVCVRRVCLCVCVCMFMSVYQVIAWVQWQMSEKAADCAM